MGNLCSCLKVQTRKSILDEGPYVKEEISQKTGATTKEKPTENKIINEEDYSLVPKDSILRESNIGSQNTSEIIEKTEAIESRKNSGSFHVDVPILHDEVFIKHIDNNLSVENVFKGTWYRNDETPNLYSQRFIVAFIRSEFDPQREGYKEIFNKDNMILSIKDKGSFVTEEFPIIRMDYKLPVSDFPEGTSIPDIVKYMEDPLYRNPWDKGLKEFKLIEGNSDLCVMHMIMNKPMILISERDIIEKRIDFYHEGQFYSFATSCNDNYIPIVEDVVRITDILACYLIYRTEDSFIIKSLSQVDFKMKTPQSIINVTLPKKLKDWYNGIKEEVKKNFAKETSPNDTQTPQVVKNEEPKTQELSKKEEPQPENPEEKKEENKPENEEEKKEEPQPDVPEEKKEENKPENEEEKKEETNPTEPTENQEEEGKKVENDENAEASLN